MLEEETTRINDTLKKMIEKSQVDESIACGLLLRCDELPMTLIVLQKSAIGKTINELRRVTKDENLSRTAKNLLRKWQQLLPRSTTARSPVDNATTNVSTSHRSSSAREAPTVNETLRSPSKKICSASAMPASEAVRMKSRALLASALTGTDLPEGSADPVELSARLEGAIFEDIKETSVKYGRRVRSRVFNLRDAKNPELRRKVLIGLITVEQLAVMSAEEMTSDALKEECARFKEISHRERQLAVDEGTGSDLLQCEQCKANNCSYSELQTLSGDEPMTVFALCRNCGHRWRG